MLQKIYGTNLFHIKFLDRHNIKCQNGPDYKPDWQFESGLNGMKTDREQKGD
jgi:hypothetical protein